MKEIESSISRVVCEVLRAVEAGPWTYIDAANPASIHWACRVVPALLHPVFEALLVEEVLARADDSNLVIWLVVLHADRARRIHAQHLRLPELLVSCRIHLIVLNVDIAVVCICVEGIVTITACDAVCRLLLSFPRSLLFENSLRLLDLVDECLHEVNLCLECGRPFSLHQILEEALAWDKLSLQRMVWQLAFQVFVTQMERPLVDGNQTCS